MDISSDQAADVTAALERLYRLFRRLSTPSELSLTTVGTLSTLEQSGPCRLTELAGREEVTQPAMTQIVSRLQESGLAARATDPADGRVVRVHITEAGREALARRRTARAEKLTELLARLSPAEQAALTSALPTIDTLARLGAADLPHAPHQSL